MCVYAWAPPGHLVLGSRPARKRIEGWRSGGFLWTRHLLGGNKMQMYWLGTDPLPPILQFFSLFSFVFHRRRLSNDSCCSVHVRLLLIPISLIRKWKHDLCSLILLEFSQKTILLKRADSKSLEMSPEVQVRGKNLSSPEQDGLPVLEIEAGQSRAYTSQRT